MKPPSLKLKLKSQLTMNLQLQQAIRLLQLSGQALEVELQAMVEANPLLEYEYNDDLSQKIQETPLSSFTSSRSNELSQPAEYLDQKANESLKQHLHWQLDIAPFSREERLIAIAIIDVISEDGYITCSLQEICVTLKEQEALTLELSAIEAVLFKIQQFEPIGVGARNLAECLSIQSNALPQSTPYLDSIKTLVNSYLEPLAKRDYNTLTSELKLSESQLKSVIATITQLNPTPGRQISFLKKTEYIIPDLILKKKNNKFVVQLNKAALPTLRIKTEYVQLLQGAPAKENTFFRQHLKEAEWFLKSLKNRYSTLLKVGKNIVKQQEDFLEKGEEFMHGLLLQDVAKETDLHKSTVSRITTQKYIYTHRGVFELKYFFSNQLTNETGISHSAKAIRATLKKLISSEPKTHPYSDQKLTQLLFARGMAVSRRTVTKYREALKIASSHKRRGVHLMSRPIKLSEE